MPKPKRKVVARPAKQRRGNAAWVIANLQALEREAIEQNQPERALWIEVIMAVVSDIVRPSTYGRTIRADRDAAWNWLTHPAKRRDREMVFEFAGLDPAYANDIARVVRSYVK